jgi:hypothetical protein
VTLLSAGATVMFAKGSPPAILLKQGRWVKLPSVGRSVGNSMRAWLRQQ